MRVESGARRSDNTAGASHVRWRLVLGRLIRGIGWVATGPLDWAGRRSISRSAGYIRGLSASLGSRLHRDGRFRTTADGSFDLEATAFLYGIGVHELRGRLWVRRRQTARIAYAMFALGCLFLTGWVWQALAVPWTGARLVMALEFLPFCVLFFLMAFYNALLNFQLRIGRTAGWREYLMTSEPFWPR
jgi:hypothetical protein